MMAKRNDIKLGTHGEDYGNWMSTPVFYVFGGLAALALILAVVSFALLHIAGLGVLFTVAAAVLAILLCRFYRIRRQYAFGGGNIMENVHNGILSHLRYDGRGTLLDVGCGSGALSIRADLIWPEAKVIGVDSWGAMYGYSKALCEKNAASEGVGARCDFRRGDANRLDLPDESVDAVVSNYVYHNIAGADRQALLLETLRTLKKGGAFAINDTMPPRLYGDMEAFVQKLRAMGYREVRLVDTSTEIFGSRFRAGTLLLGNSKMLSGIK